MFKSINPFRTSYPHVFWDERLGVKCEIFSVETKGWRLSIVFVLGIHLALTTSLHSRVTINSLMGKSSASKHEVHAWLRFPASSVFLA